MSLALDEQRFGAAVPMELFFDVAGSCHHLFERDASQPLQTRVLQSLHPDQVLPVLLPFLAESIAERDRTRATVEKALWEAIPTIVFWFSNELAPFCDEGAQTYEAAPLHFRRYADSDAVWHNQTVSTARWALKTVLENRLKERFPQWDHHQTSARLKSVPPLVLLEDEYSEMEQRIKSALTLNFLMSFLRTQYLIWLGFDPIPADAETKLPPEMMGASALLKALDNHRPRYPKVSHKEFFQVVKGRQPFAGSYADARSELRPICSDNSVFEDSILAILFKFSMPYARDFLDSKRLYESLTDSLRSGFTALGWLVKHLAEIKDFLDPLKRSEADLSVLSFYTPIGAGLMDLLEGGEGERDGHTCLDNTRSAPDEEFDG